jgi:phosphoribosylamine--glycine ligase
MMSAGHKVLVVGGGGREHALALRLLASDSVSEVIACPGNAGMAGSPPTTPTKTLRCLAGDPVEIAAAQGVDLVVIGPEVPLCEGLADEMGQRGILCFGPSKAAARLEGSKSFMKDFCHRHGIRAAQDVVVKKPEDLDAALAQFEFPPVVKADGLCAGKGVVVAESFEEARQAAQGMLSGVSFGEAGATVVLEERLFGSEASIHAICDGNIAVILPTAQDHKRIFDGDQGPNTGGMGTYAPAPVVDANMLSTIRKDVMNAVVSGMKADGVPFVGTLFAGLMISASGEPVVLEFNVRFGDPETQVLTLLTEGDFGEALAAAARGELKEEMLSASAEHAMCVVLAAEGYPEAPRQGDVITGLEAASGIPGVSVFHAGTQRKGDTVVTSGGRVLGVTARGETLAQAQERVYRAVALIDFRGKQYRRDIGHRALSA